MRRSKCRTRYLEQLESTLIRQLYAETKAILEQGAEALNRENRMTEAKKALREKLSEWDNKDIKIETGRHYPPYWQGFQVDAQFAFANCSEISERMKLK